MKVKWISALTKMPTREGYYLVTDGGSTISIIGYFYNGINKWDWSNATKNILGLEYCKNHEKFIKIFEVENIRYWIPIPHPFHEDYIRCGHYHDIRSGKYLNKFKRRRKS
jgi:hypothetical protein